ncbi:MAG: hypothetical protein EXS36_06865 [Pedosphaera sp.]|nr:hypothetical protein [Pedosphaera sp.]
MMGVHEKCAVPCHAMYPAIPHAPAMLSDGLSLRGPWLVLCLLSFICLLWNLLAAAAPAPSFFGLTNLCAIHLTISDADWQWLGSRGGPRNPMIGNGGNNGIPGLFEEMGRGLFGGAERDPGRAAPPPGHLVNSGGDGESRYP